jgi:hypothetical protein
MIAIRENPDRNQSPGRPNGVVLQNAQTTRY